MKQLALFIFILYFLIVGGSYTNLENPILDKAGLIRDNFFPQDWSMFSQPPMHNQHLYYRYVLPTPSGQKDTTDFFEVLQPLYENQQYKKMVLGRMSYQLWQATQSIKTSQKILLDTASHFIKEPTSEAVNAFIFKQLQSTADYQVIHNHARLLLQEKFPNVDPKEVLISFHTYEEAIPPCPFGPQKTKKPVSLVYNSPIHQIFP